MLRVDVQGRRLEIAAQHQGTQALVAEIPGTQYQPKTGLWVCRRTLMMTERVREAALTARDQYQLAPTMTPAFGELITALKRFDAAERYRTADPEDLPPAPTRTALWKPQLKPFWWATERGGGPDAARENRPGGGSSLAMEMGTGKSLTTIACLEAWGCQLAVVLCPKSVLGVWPREFRKHAGQPWSVWAGHAYGRSGKHLTNPSVRQRAASAERFIETARIKETPVVLVIHYDVVWRPEIKDLLLGLARDGLVDALVLDESQRAKTPGSKASQTCATLATYVDRVLLDSGTQMDEGPLDLFGQYRAQDVGIFGGNYTQFKAENAVTVPNPHGKGTIVVGARTDRLDYLASKFSRHSYVLRAADLFVGDLALPESKPAVERTFELSAAARRIYEQLDTTMTADIAGGRLTTANAMTKLLRLQQITSGHVPVTRPCPVCQPADIPWTPTIEAALEEAILESQQRIDDAEPVRAGDGEVWTDAMDADRAVQILGQRRVDAARGCLECQGSATRVTIDVVDDGRKRLLAEVLQEEVPDVAEPVVVFCVFRHDLDAIAEVAAEQGRVYGELSGRRRDGLNADGEMVDGIGVLGCQIQSGGVGVDMTRAALGIYHTVSPRLGLYWQSRKRYDRPGQTRVSRTIHLVAENTVERLLYMLLARKLGVVETVQLIAEQMRGGRIDYDSPDLLDRLELPGREARNA